MADLSNNIIDYIDEHIKIRYNEIEAATYQIMERFGLYDKESIQKFVAKKNCSLAFTEDFRFIGVVVNNRWLYTTNGLIVGKKGKRWKINEPKGE